MTNRYQQTWALRLHEENREAELNTDLQTQLRRDRRARELRAENLRRTRRAS